MARNIFIITLYGTDKKNLATLSDNIKKGHIYFSDIIIIFSSKDVVYFEIHKTMVSYFAVLHVAMTGLK